MVQAAAANRGENRDGPLQVRAEASSHGAIVMALHTGLRARGDFSAQKSSGLVPKKARPTGVWHGKLLDRGRTSKLR